MRARELVTMAWRPVKQARSILGQKRHSNESSNPQDLQGPGVIGGKGGGREKRGKG